jgi:hypothetical protein
LPDFDEVGAKIRAQEIAADSGLYPEIGRRAFADRRAAIEFAASLSLVENHRLIQ